MPNFALFRKHPKPAPKETDLAELDGADLEVWGFAPSLAGMFAMKATGLPRGDALLWSNTTLLIRLPVRMKNAQIRCISEAASTPRVYQITCVVGVFSLVCACLLCQWQNETADAEKHLLWKMGEDGGASWDTLQAEAEKEKP